MSTPFKKRNISRHLYFILVIIIFILTNIINLCHTMALCSFIYILLAFTANLICELSDKRTTIQLLIICILANAPFLFNINYYINGNKIDGILVSSFISMIITIYCGTYILSKFKSVCTFHLRNLVSLIICSLIDSTCMSLFLLLSPLPTNKIIFIFLYDLSFKFFYSLLFFGFTCSIYLKNIIKIKKHHQINT